MNIYLERVHLEQNIYRFYEINWSELKIYLKFGRIGAVGTSQEKKFYTRPEAKEFFYRTIAQKLRKGYEKSIKGWRPSLKGQESGQMYFDFYG